ncbi:SDR family oxidoreductase [Flammeovirgaceae bacterium SG7u.111]|nr:SDR family oxidoreductase [Flammeovirgaceae bacterium SG7u.132]WPO37480.1 SDR family oxidoreductase [Flammeovirgaceae bacterium SG7u.111]
MKGKVVVITGGNSGIGKALVKEYGSKGSKVAFTGRRPEAVAEAQAEFAALGIEVMGIVADVSKEEDNKRMADEVLSQWGKIDILINNAGISMRALFEDLDLSVMHQLMNINFYGTVYATKYCLPSIIENKGSVIGISSIAGFRGLPARAGYTASKFALQGFLEVLRTEMRYKGVHVMIACPGFTASNIRKKSLTEDGTAQKDSPRNEGKMMPPEECAAHIYKANKKRKKLLILTMLGKLTVLFNKFFPSFMDRMTYNAMAKEPNSPLKKP